MNPGRLPVDKATIKSGGPIGNLDFLRALLASLAALAFSGAILIILFLLTTRGQFTAHAGDGADVAPQAIGGSELATILGTTRIEGETLLVSRLQPIPGDKRAILSHRVRLDADKYPFLHYNIDPRPAGTNIYLFWRKAEDPGSTFRTLLYDSGARETTLNLSRMEQWEGTITEVGIDIYGDLRGRVLGVERLSFSPFSGVNVLRAVWSEWTLLTGWTQRSINHLPAQPENAIVSPTVAAAVLAGGALLIFALAYPWVKRLGATSLVLTVLVPWLGLDLLWQRQLSAQLADTASTFANKTQHQKMQASTDGALYEYARHLKDEVLPAPGKQIFLLHNSTGHNFARLRLQYHLLPHNIYNYGKYPNKADLRRGDYILVLGAIPELGFDPDRQVLTWWRTNHLKVRRVDHHEVGDLYRVVKLPRGGRPNPPGGPGSGGDEGNQ